MSNINRLTIALSGKAGVGKDVFADVAVNEFGFKKVSLASSLKDEVSDFLNKFGIKYEERNLYGTQQDKEEIISFPPFFDFSSMVEEYRFLERRCRNLTFRLLLQLWGSEYRRNESDSYWIDKYHEKTKDIPLVICSDLRFINEYNYFKSIHALCIRIEREDSFKSASSNHISETELDDIDNWYYFIENNSTLEDYKDVVRFTIKNICNWRGECQV